MNKLLICLTLFLISACEINNAESQDHVSKIVEKANSSIILLGTIQDAGSPHIGCQKDCCKALFDNPDKDRQVISLGVFDSSNNHKYLFDATPDISRQLKSLKTHAILSEAEMPNGVFLTHAHIGHYAGLMYFGKEATDAKNVDVFAMPRMKTFLETNGPWDQLVSRKNIKIVPIENEKELVLSKGLSVTPIQVPHRDEYSETVGYRIQGPSKTALFIPDIDKWDKWEKDIVALIKTVDYAFLDATFYSGEEINNRDITQIPHPFIIESFRYFEALNKTDRKKIIFIHFNHTNPVIDPTSQATKEVLDQGYRIGRINEVFEL